MEILRVEKRIGRGLGWAEVLRPTFSSLIPNRKKISHVGRRFYLGFRGRGLFYCGYGAKRVEKKEKQEALRSLTLKIRRRLRLRIRGARWDCREEVIKGSSLRKSSRREPERRVSVKGKGRGEDKKTEVKTRKEK